MYPYYYKKRAFNASNLALLGALDDFYDAYCQIRDLYDAKITECLQELPEGKLLWPDTVDRLLQTSVRKICEPIINKHLDLFTGYPNHIFCTAYGFKTFSFYKLDTPPEDRVRLVLKFKHISFSEFLKEIEFATTRILYNWVKKNVTKYHSLEKMCADIDERIDAKAAKKLRDYRISAITEAPTDAILYLFDNLSSTACYQKNHPIVPAHFVADMVDGSGQVILPVHYCNYCNKYFIGTKTLALFEKCFGKFVVQKKFLAEDSSGFSSFRQESLLHQLGYNVIDGNMGDLDRQNLLAYLLDHGKISYVEICVTIEQNIRLFQNSYRHQLAIAKWKSDLRFIGGYILAKDSQPQP